MLQAWIKLLSLVFGKDVGPHPFFIPFPVHWDEYTLKHLSEGIKAVLDSKGISKTHIYGSSFGGLLVQAFVYFCPARVDKMIISNSGTTLNDPKCNNLPLFK